MPGIIMPILCPNEKNDYAYYAGHNNYYPSREPYRDKGRNRNVEMSKHKRE